MSNQKPQNTDEQLMTINQFALRFNIHPESVRRWLRAKRLQGLKAGSQWRIEPSEMGRIKKEGGV